jgi:hypothetical protein
MGRTVKITDPKPGIYQLSTVDLKTILRGLANFPLHKGHPSEDFSVEDLTNRAINAGNGVAVSALQGARIPDRD